MIRVMLTLDPITNQLITESTTDAAQTLLLLERARLSLVSASNRPREETVAIPTPEQAQELAGVREKWMGKKPPF